jgi:hypothetical protein
MTAEDWHQYGRATWVYVHREPNTWRSYRCRCQCQGRDKWVVQIEQDEPVVLPSWQEVLDVTPMLLGIYIARKAP